MERAGFIRHLRPMVLLGVLIFVFGLFLLPDNARCEDVKRTLEIYSKYTDGPVIVPNIDYGEPGHDPFGVGLIGDIGDNTPSSSIDDYGIGNNKIFARKDFAWFFRLFINQLVVIVQ